MRSASSNLNNTAVSSIGLQSKSENAKKSPLLISRVNMERISNVSEIVSAYIIADWSDVSLRNAGSHFVISRVIALGDLTAFSSCESFKS
jgi:hypothetical protein